MPCVNMFSARVTRSTLPVRSPLPNSVPSTRSAPAIRPSSVAATAVPRSLCGCSETMRFSRLSRLRHIHSIWSAWTFGVDISTVAGRLTISLLSGVGCTISATALQISAAKFELGAGEALRRVLEAVAASGLGRHVGDHLRRVDGDLLDPRPVLLEHDAALQLAGGIVEVHDRPDRALERLEGLLDQLGPALDEHLQRHVLGRVALLDAPAGEIEIGLRGRREADLDLLEVHRQEQLEEAGLACRAPSGRPAPGCRRAGRPSTRSAAR